MSTRTEDRMDDRMDNRMDNRMENRMGDRMRDRMGDHVEDRMGDRMEVRTGDQMENRPENRMASSSPADADISAFGFPFEGREAAVFRERGTGDRVSEDCSPAWSSRFRRDSDDQVRVEEGEGSGHGEVGGGGEREEEEEAGLRGELEVFASHLRQEFELKVGAFFVVVFTPFGVARTFPGAFFCSYSFGIAPTFPGQTKLLL